MVESGAPSKVEGQRQELLGTEWLAPGVGLVRCEQRALGRLAYEIALVALEDG